MSVSDYTIAVGPWSSGPVQELTFYSSWTLDKNLDDGCTFSFTVPGYSPEAAYISELDTDVWVYRSGVLNQRFRIVGVSQSWGSSGEDEISVQAVCYRRLLATRYVQSPLTFTNVSQGDIIWDLIQHTQATVNGDLGITAGNLGPSVLRDRTYEVGQNILDVIVDMTNVINGPTWDIDENLELVVSQASLYPTNPTPLVLGGTVRAMERPSAASKFGNVALVSGNQDATTTVIQEAFALSIDPRGRWEKRASYPSVILQQTLQDHAEGLLTDLQSPTSIWAVDVVPERYFGDGDYKLGDFVTLIQPPSTAAPISTPAVSVQGQVLAIQVQQNADGAIGVQMRVLEIVPPLPSVFTNYLIIAGGGGGGGTPLANSSGGGGGGAGGYRANVVGENSGGGASAEAPFSAVLGVAYSLIVGAGGSGQQLAGSQGGNSVFGSRISTGGGGGGGSNTVDQPAGNGGSGGGASNTNGAGAFGIGATNQGFNGGGSQFGSGNYPAGGGGGAGAVGQSVTVNTTGGNGGAGVASSITGSSVTRAGGGGGSTYNGGTVGTGSASGGNGKTNGGTASSATANTGSGGGGSAGPGAATGGNGGSGVIILRIPDTHFASFSGGVTQSSASVGTDTVYTITAAGPTDTVTFAEV